MSDLLDPPLGGLRNLVGLLLVVAEALGQARAYLSARGLRERRDQVDDALREPALRIGNPKRQRRRDRREEGAESWKHE